MQGLGVIDEPGDGSISDGTQWQGQPAWEPAVAAHTEPVSALAVSPDSRWVASGSEDMFIILWEVETQSVVRKWWAHDGTVWHLAFSPDSLHLASAGEDGRVRVWDVDFGERLKTLDVQRKVDEDEDDEGEAEKKTKKNAVPMVAWSPDGTKLAASSNDMTVRIWDAQTYRPLHVLDHAGSQDASVLFSHCGRYLASGSEDYTCRVWNVDTGMLHKELKGHSGGRPGVVPSAKPLSVDRITTAAFDPQDRRIATASEDGRIWIWDVDTGKELIALHQHSAPVWAVSFSPDDGKYILSGSSHWTVKICDSFTGECVIALKDHEDMIQSATFSPDGRFVASASSDKTVRLWRRSDGANLKTFDEHNEVTHALFSPDGTTLSSGSKDGSIHIRVLKDLVELN